MRNLFFSAIALITLGMAATEADAQFYVVKDGKILYSLSEGLPDSVVFEKPNLLNIYNVDGYDAVDLGLPSKTLWATQNIGATAPEEPGDYFAWGEVETKEVYNWSTYKWVIDGGSTLEDIDKYTIADNQKDGTNWYDDGGNFIGDGKTELDYDDDVAVQLWGGNWQMPTYEQQSELINNCYWVSTNTYNGKSVNGYIVYKVKDDGDKGGIVYKGDTDTKGYSVDTDAHIFLPAAGYRKGANLYGAGSYGGYWSRSLRADYSGSARCLGFNSGYDLSNNYCGRYYGPSVRAVQRKK